MLTWRVAMSFMQCRTSSVSSFKGKTALFTSTFRVVWWSVRSTFTPVAFVQNALNSVRFAPLQPQYIPLRLKLFILALSARRLSTRPASAEQAPVARSACKGRRWCSHQCLVCRLGDGGCFGSLQSLRPCKARGKD
eukprot:symbB.v1.2.021265.t1/scaffold1756.1/size102926/4